MGLWHFFFTCLEQEQLVMLLVLAIFCDFEPYVALEARFNMELCTKRSCTSMLQILWIWQCYFQAILYGIPCCKKSAIREDALKLPKLAVLKVVLLMQQKGLEGGILSLPLTFWYMFCSGVHIQRDVLK